MRGSQFYSTELMIIGNRYWEREWSWMALEGAAGIVEEGEEVARSEVMELEISFDVLLNGTVVISSPIPHMANRSELPSAVVGGTMQLAHDDRSLVSRGLVFQFVSAHLCVAHGIVEMSGRLVNLCESCGPSRDCEEQGGHIIGNVLEVDFDGVSSSSCHFINDIPTVKNAQDPYDL
jgi:hypothetical protein